MLLSSLPHIPDLIRADSPVCRVIGASRYVLRGVVINLDEHTLRVATEHGVVERWEHGVWDLDLTRRHGRADAAWWARARLDSPPDDETWRVVGAAEAGRDLHPAEVDRLARLVLRLAECEHPPDETHYIAETRAAMGPA